ncbi:DinB family protein [Paenibacillus sp.]|uniref:DinB family protein n=1 Tax=Paenibacillus sp. TaxID=58172 RepID=UPI002D73708C|nr:DinB family protein [Paenibacillus sp.]HZG84562.1 DinB family protein [Paenibacillus sp.]
MSVKDSILSIQQTTDQIVRTCERLPQEVLLWKPSEEKWSVMEVLCHVEEVVPYWLAELQETIESPQRSWGRGLQHEGRLAAVAVAHERNASEVLRNITNSKRQVEDVLGAISEDELGIEAESRNPRFGTKPLSFIVEHLLKEHLVTHYQQIMRNIEAAKGATHD